MSSHPAGLRFSQLSSSAVVQQTPITTTSANQKIMQSQQPSQSQSSTIQNQQNQSQAAKKGFQQSNFYDSETDIANSIENLSLEERYVLLHTARVEPQGQESIPENLMSGRYINDNRLSSSTDSTRYASSNRSMSETRNPIFSPQGTSQQAGHSQTGPPVAAVQGVSTPTNNNSNRNSLKEINSNRSSMDASTCSYNTLIIHNDDNIFSNDYSSSPSFMNKKERPRSYGEKAMQDITEIPDEYLENTQVLKHLAKELQRNKSNNNSNCGRDSGMSENPNMDKANQYDDSQNAKAKSKSQPDLTRLGEIDMETVEALMKENASLKQQLNNCLMKAAKTQKLEDEVTKIYRAHEELEQSCARREKLELTIRTKLQNELRRAQELNRVLRDQVEMHQSQLLAPSEHQLLIAQFFTQNKEIAAAKDRQEIELSAQRSTLQEQRNHIGILDSALTNTQNNMRRLEEELRKKTIYIEHLIKMQQNTLQPKQNDRKLIYENELSKDSNRSGSSTASESKWQLDKDGQISRLENECAKLDQRHLDDSNTQEADRIIAEAKQEKIRYLEEVHSAKKKVGELQNHLKGLESRLAEKDALIRALQGQKNYGSSNSYDSYNLSNDSFALNPLVYNSQASFNVSNSSFNTTANASLLDPAYGQNTGGYNPGNSFSGGFVSSNQNYGPNTSNYNQSALNLQSISIPSNYSPNNQGGYNSNYITNANYANPNSNTSTYDRANSFDHHQYEVARNSIDDHMKKQLDEQLLSKKGLCCFPGLSGKKPIQSLLSDEVSVLSTNNSDAFLQKLAHIDQRERERQHQEHEMNQSNNSQKPEDIVMLEKQGRCSQKTRNNPMGNLVQVSQSVGQNMTDISHIGSPTSKVPKILGGILPSPPRKDRGASLPPIAVPRPPRSLKPPRKIEYDRLTDSDHKKRSQTPPNQSHRSYELKTSSLKRGEYNRREYSPASNYNIKHKNYGSIHPTNEYPSTKNYTRLEDSKVSYSKKESSPSQKRSLLPRGNAGGVPKTSRDSINSASSGSNSNNSRSSPIHTKTDSSTSNIIYQHSSGGGGGGGGQFSHARTPPKYIRLTPPPHLQHPLRQQQNAFSQSKISLPVTSSSQQSSPIYSHPPSSSSSSMNSASLPPKPASSDGKNSRRGGSAVRNMGGGGGGQGVGNAENRYRIQF